MTKNNEKKDELRTKDMQFNSDLLAKEEEISSNAYDLLEHALSLIESGYYDDALEALRQAIKLYEQINRKEEIDAINEKISEVYVLKEQLLRTEKIESKTSSEILIEKSATPEENIRKQAVVKPLKPEIEQQKKQFEESKKQEQEISEYLEVKTKQEIVIEDEAKKRKVIEDQVKAMKVKVREKKKEEELDLETQISELVDKAERMAREYEVALKQGLKKGLIPDCAYPEIIEIYKDVRKKLLEKGWKDQIPGYTNQIKIYEEKLEKDKKLRKIEAQKAEKRKEYEQLYEVEKKNVQIKEDVEKLKIITEQARKKEEEEKVRAKIDEMINKAQKMDKEYELSLKKRKFIKSPYEEIIQIYENVQDILKENNWMQEASLYNESIKLYRGKLEKDKKLRETELRKIQKDKEIEEMYKIKKEPTIQKPLKSKEVEILEKKNEELLNKALSLIDTVEKEVKNYELTSKTISLKQESPYQKAILAYKDAVKIFEKIGWKNEANRLNNTIKFYDEKYEKDKNLRILEIERTKAQELELEAQEEALKVFQAKEKEKQQALSQIERLKALKSQEEQEISKMALELIDKAESMSKKYESDLKMGKQSECPYGQVVEIYKEAKSKFEQINWTSQAKTLNETIAYYKGKSEADKKERALEAERIRQREQELKKQQEVLLAEQSREKERQHALAEIAKKKKRKTIEEQELSKLAFELIDKAESVAKKYESDLKAGMRPACPYDQVVEIYNEAKSKFEQMNWTDQAKTLINTIAYYKGKSEADKKERILEAERTKQREQELKKQQEALLAELAQEKERQHALAEIAKTKERKTMEEQELSKLAFELIDKAESVAKKYESDLKAGMRPACPYDRIVEIYNDAKSKFEQLNWIDQAKTLINTIAYYKGKSEADKKERILEAERIKQREQEMKAEQEALLTELAEEQERQRTLAEIAKTKERKTMEEQELSKLAFELIDNAENVAKKYESDLKAGKRPKCPYDQVVETYSEAKSKFEQLDWTDQAKTLVNTIAYYKGKSEADKKERILEIERIKRREQELKIEQEALLTELSQEQERQRALAEIAKKKEKKTMEEQEITKMALELIDKAEDIAKQYEFNLKVGMRPECPYDQVVEIYSEAKSKFEQLNWIDQAKTLVNTIAYYKGKSEADKKERILEAERINLREQEMKAEQEALLAELAQEQERQRALADIAKKKKRKTIDEQEISNVAFELIDKAESVAKKYESDLKAGIQSSCPYDQVVEIYNEAKSKFEQMNWTDQVKILINTIAYYKGKSEADKKERASEVERTKRREQELKEQQEVLLTEQAREKERQRALADIAKTKERKTLEELKVSKIAFELIDKAEDIAKQYELDLKAGMQPECPYDQVVEIYKEAKSKLESINWTTQARPLNETIAYYKGKFEADKKERALEIERIKRREQELKEQQKVLLAEQAKEKERQRALADIAKTKERKTLEEQEISKLAFELIDNAESLAKQYEADLKEGKLPDCVYADVVKKYQEAKGDLEKIGWTSQAATLTNTIKYYREKLEEDKKYRDLRTEKVKRQEQESMALITFLQAEQAKEHEKQLELAKKAKIKELKTKKEKQISSLSFELIEKAETMAKKYESDLREDKLPDCVYGDVINMYREAKDNFEQIEWSEQSAALMNTINYYKERLDEDKKFRESRAERIRRQEQELKEQREIFLAEQAKKRMRQREFEELERKKQLELQKKEEISKLAFDIIEHAESLTKQYESDLNMGKLPDCVYGDVINMYQEAKSKFEEIGFKDQVTTLLSTINYYREKLEADKKHREFRAERILKRQQELKEQRDALLTEKMKEKELKQRLAELERIKQQELQKEEKISKLAFQKIEQAESLAKQYESDLKEGKLPDCVYSNVIEMYQDAVEKFKGIGFKDQVSTLLSTINYYREKLDSDKNIRALKAERLKKQEQELKEMEEKRKLAELEREKEEKLREEQERIRLLKAKEEEAIFEAKKSKAFSILDDAKLEIMQNNFDNAIDLYKESEGIFSEIGWQEGIKMVKDSILSIKNKKEEFEFKQKEIERQKEEQILAEKQLEEKIAKEKEIEKMSQEEKRMKLLEIQEQKDKEKSIADKAYSLLEEGTMLLENKEFNKANERYLNARDLFKEIEWLHEVSRINNELLFNLKREQNKAEKLKQEEERAILMRQEEEKRQELEKIKKEEERKKLKKVIMSDSIDKNIRDHWERANKIIESLKYNESIMQLKEVVKKMEKSGKAEEIEKIYQQISTIGIQAHVPLIALEKLDARENMDKFELCFKALDKAEISLNSNNLKKAISELNEARFNLKDSKLADKYNKKIDETIENCKKQIGVKPLKEMPKVEEKPTPVAAVTEDVQAIIAARREERRKKVLDLLGKK